MMKLTVGRDGMNKRFLVVAVVFAAVVDFVVLEGRNIVHGVE